MDCKIYHCPVPPPPELHWYPVSVARSYGFTNPLSSLEHLMDQQNKVPLSPVLWLPMYLATPKIICWHALLILQDHAFRGSRSNWKQAVGKLQKAFSVGPGITLGFFVQGNYGRVASHDGCNVDHCLRVPQRQFRYCHWQQVLLCNSKYVWKWII